VAAARLQDIGHAIPAGPLGYFVKLMEAYRLATLGWVAHLEKNDAEALKQLAAAAELEDAIGPHPVSPGPLLPAREVLGDLRFELGRFSEARVAYEETLARYPGRLRSVAGAMRAAKKVGDVKGAQAYARQLVEMAGKGGGQVLAEARGLIR
jgi:Tfp pilus assembly protein PilF